MTSSGTRADQRQLRPLKDYWGIVAVIITAVAYLIVKLLKLDVEAEAIASILSLVFLSLWAVWRYLRVGCPARIALSILLVAVFSALAYYAVWSSRPRFKISALDTLEGDINVYEVTDHLIGTQLANHVITTTLALQVRPRYYGREKFGRVVALLSGDSGRLPVERLLWADFSSASTTKDITLTLVELCELSGIKKNAPSPGNLLRPDDPYFPEAKLTVSVALKTDSKHPWTKQEILVRNTPWEQRSDLVWRNDRHEVDLYLRNLGGAGEFMFYYNLVRLDKRVDSNTHPMWSGATYVESGRMPEEPVALETAEFFTHTHVLTTTLTPGHYMLEVSATKKQSYARFLDQSISFFDSPDRWIFGGAGMLHPYVIPAPSIDVNTQPEWDRLRAEGIDLGPALSPLQEITLLSGAKWQYQEFDKGEIYVRDGKTYAVYGDIYDLYTRYRGRRGEMSGFPLSPMEPVTSSLGTTGTMMYFEGPYWPDAPTVLYASAKGKVVMWGLISQAYINEHGGHAGWLGFPVTDELSDNRIEAHNAIQMFEGGYLVWRDSAIQPPIAVAYFGPQGTRVDVQATQLWQATGIQVEQGDRIVIVQVGGAWHHWGSTEKAYDANGDPSSELHEGRTLPSALVGTLIGRVGENEKDVFPVGRWGVITAPAGGILYLSMNDSGYDDNSGFITVQIVIESSPNKQ